MSRDYDGKTHGIVNENAEMRSNRRLRVRVGLGKGLDPGEHFKFGAGGEGAALAGY